MTHHIRQSVTLPCSAHTAFAAWLDSKTHGSMINGVAVIEPKVGGSFDIWEGAIQGVTTLIDKEDLRIEQTWRYNYEDWPENQPSRLTVWFEPKDETTCTLHFHQNGVPHQYQNDVASGWQQYYWQPMQEYFAAHRD